MLKLTDNPALVYPACDDLRHLSGRWWVAHTKPRCEKALAHDLARREVAYFLPMIRRVTFSGGRKRRGLRPLFGGYLFFCGDDEARLKAIMTDRVAQVLDVPDQARFIEEIADLYRGICSDAALDPYPFAAVGCRCRVTCGPLEGIEGAVIRRDDGSTRFVLQVSMLGQGAAIEIDADLLEAVE